MPKVTYTNGELEGGSITVEVKPGTSLLEAARACGATEGSACGGVCACSTCHVWVRQGFDSLSDMEDEENDILDKAFDVKATSRLGCQAKVGGADVTVEITRESLQAFFDEHPHEREELAKRRAAGAK